MAKLSEKALRKRDAVRDIGAELLASVREMKAGQAGHVHSVPASAITDAHTKPAVVANVVRIEAVAGLQPTHPSARMTAAM
jgi:hypothetical protein